MRAVCLRWVHVLHPTGLPALTNAHVRTAPNRYSTAATQGQDATASTKPLPGPPVVYHPEYSAPQLAAGHRFPMQVFRRIYELLLEEGVVLSEQVHMPTSLPSDAELASVHCPDYLAAFSSGTLDTARMRRIGFGEATRSQELIRRTKAEVAGTLLTARLALQYGLACNTAGGTHHAQYDSGSGYCILNDLAYTAVRLVSEQAVQRVLILDLDVHQGDGTASILGARSDAACYHTLSVHAERNFPARKQASSRDVGLADGVGDDEYCALVAHEVTQALRTFQPDLVLYDAGVDVHADDALGRLSLTDAGLARREALVLDTCAAWGVPLAGYVGGGYADCLDTLARRHMHLHRAAQRVWEDHALGHGLMLDQ